MSEPLQPDQMPVALQRGYFDPTNPEHWVAELDCVREAGGLDDFITAVRAECLDRLASPLGPSVEVAVIVGDIVNARLRPQCVRCVREVRRKGQTGDVALRNFNRFGRYLLHRVMVAIHAPLAPTV